MKAAKVKERVDKAGIAALKAYHKATGIPVNVTMRIKPLITDGQHFVREEILWNKIIHSSYRQGPFESEDEALHYAEQRASGYENQVKPISGTDGRANTFIFVYPPP